jgi:hypothetical protein
MANCKASAPTRSQALKFGASAGGEFAKALKQLTSKKRSDTSQG